MFNNVGNMGLPLMLFTFGDEALGAAVVLERVADFTGQRVGVILSGGNVDVKRYGELLLNGV